MTTKKHIVELPVPDRSGYCYLDRGQTIEALEKLGLTIGRENGRRSAAVAFRGTIEGIEVHLTAWNCGWELSQYGHPTGRIVLEQSSNPPEDDGAMYLRLKYWMPDNVHLRGKGRDKKAWDIYESLVLALDNVNRVFPKDAFKGMQMTYEEAQRIAEEHHKVHYADRNETFETSEDILRSWSKL